MLTNYVQVPRPRPGLDLSTWQLVPTGAAVADPGPDGVEGIARVTSAGGKTGYVVEAPGVPGGSGGVTVYGTLQVRPSVAFTPNYVQIYAYSSGSAVASESLPVSEIPAGVWTEVSFDMFVSPAFDEVRILITDDGSELVEGETLDAAMGYISTDPAPLTNGFHYFDGATPNDLDENGRGLVYEWTGAQWASVSTRRTGFVGVLTATWNPDLGGVHLIVDGGMWPQPVSQLRIERSTAGDATVPVRGAEIIWAPGGGYVGTDHEMPINTLVQYTVYGYDENGDLVDQSTAVVDTPATKTTLYVKAPGNADLTQKPILRSVGTIESATRGGAYQIAGGGALSQSAGADTRRVSITVGTRDAGEARSLEGLLDVARTILLQDGNSEPEIPNGWYFVSSWGRDNVAQLGFGAFDYRTYTLELTATAMPAGVGVRTTGTTWGALMSECETWQAVLDTYPTWLDVVLGDAGGA